MPSERYNLALHKLFPIFGGMPSYMSISRSANTEEYWKPVLDAWQVKIDNLRKWVTTLGWLDRFAYNTWLNHYQGELKGAWAELRTGKYRKECDASRYKRRKEQERTERYAATHDFPTPPRIR